MAYEIEKYLIAKLTHAIEEVERAEKHLPSKLAQLSSKFKHLIELLKPNTSLAPNQSKLTREQLYTLNNLLSEWQRQSDKKAPYSLESLSFLYKFATNLDKIKGEVDGTIPLSGEAAQLPSTHDPSSISGDQETEAYRWSDRYVDETKVHGLDDKAMNLQRLLVSQKDNDRFKAVGIVGMRGVGKTTLSQLVFNKAEVRSHFLPRLWVCLSKQPEDDVDRRKEIVKRILMCLGVEEEIVRTANNHGLKGLLFALRLRLTGKRYLIVLDDIWSTGEQDKDFSSFCSCLDQDEKCGEKLAYGLPKGYGGAVIVTSRREELAKGMVGEENVHRLVPLSDDPESCWNIFKDSVGQNVEQLEGLKGKIVEKCAGLPLAAKMMGQIAHANLAKKPAAAPESNQDGGQ